MARSANVIGCCLLRGGKVSVVGLSKWITLEVIFSDMAVYDY